MRKPEILSASPLELVRILYSAAVRAVQNARENLRAGDIRARSREIGKVQMILVELANSVDCGRDREIGERLLALYDYMQRRLLITLQEAWSQCEVEPELAQSVR